MIMKISSLAFAVVLFAACSCGSSKETAKPESSSENSNQAAENAQPATTANSTATPSTTQQNAMLNPIDMQMTKETIPCRINISLISIGEGTDRKAREIVDGIVNKWETKLAKKLEIESIPWGREGEVDFCLLLNELSTADQVIFCKEMNDAFKSHSLVQITENQPSMHKR
jgi:hypothetical protein